jgi:hypothetical protein
VLTRISLCLLLLVSSSVLAQTAPGKFEITPFGAYTFGGTFYDQDSDQSVKIKDSPSFGLLLNFRQDFNTQWEVLYSQQNTEANLQGIDVPEEGLDIKVQYLQAGGTYQGDGDKVRPFLTATVGAAHYDVTSPGFDAETFFAFSIGPGLQFMPNKRLGFRLEARAYGTMVRSGSSLFCVSDPGGGSAGCSLNVAGDILWQFQTSAGIVFRF